MKKLLMISLLIVGICFSESNFEKGIGIETTYNTVRKSLLPGVGGKIYYSPKFAKINKYEYGLQFDICINGMIYKNKISNGDSTNNSSDLDINQIQSLDFVIQRGFGNGSFILSLFALQNSENNFAQNFQIKNMFGRLSYNYNLKNNGLELFVRRINGFTINSPIIGINLTW